MNRSNLRITLWMLAVFGTGMLVGGFGHRVYTVKAVSKPSHSRHSPEEWRRKYVEEMRARLSLDEAQVGTLNTILDRTRDRYRSTRRQIQDDQVSEIRAMLKPDQQPEYEKLRVERERKMRDSSK